MATDCLIIGFNDSNFEDYVRMVRSMGIDSGAYRDLNLAFIEYHGKPYRPLDIITHFHSHDTAGVHKPLHNVDFLWTTILYLGTYLSRRGFRFDYVNLFQLEKEKLREKLEKDNVLSVAITTTLYVTPHPILEIMSFIRKYNDRVKIIVGGPYVHNQTTADDPEEIQRQFKYIGADVYVIGQEGEQALVNVLGALKSGSDLSGIHNIAYKNGEGYVVTPASRESNLLEENMVDYRLFPKEDVGEFLSVRTSKSCPFACAYCGFPKRAGRYNYLNAGLVEKELNAIRDIGTVTTLTFIDDSFNVPLKRFKEILRMMIRNNYGFRWHSFFRCDFCDEETVSLMRDAGCEAAVLGVESASDEMLKRMNKTSRRADYLKAIPLLKKTGMLVYAGFIIGFPGETHDTVRETIDFIEETRPDFYRTQLWYCDPLTPIWQKRSEYGIRGSAFNWSYNTMDSKTAIELIENIYVSVKNSTWLPQYGFEIWSIFYLLRKGMPMERIKAFITGFNAAIKEKLLSPGRGEIRPALFESLRQACRLPAQPSSGAHAADALPGLSVQKDAEEVFHF